MALYARFSDQPQSLGGGEEGRGGREWEGRGGKEWKGRGGRELGERRGGEGGRRGGAQAEKDAQNRTESHFPAGASRGLKSGVPTHSSWQNTIAFGIQGSEEPCEKQSTPNKLKI